jgi:hypothetical protein
MQSIEKKYPESLNAELIAACGINCGVCIAHLRAKNRCAGCNSDEAGKVKHIAVCRLKNCAEMGISEQKFCFECSSFPCIRQRQLDKRYRTKYGTSTIENLKNIREVGLESFVAREKERWKCPECGGVVCMHKESCIYCGRARS